MMMSLGVCSGSTEFAGVDGTRSAHHPLQCGVLWIERLSGSRRDDRFSVGETPDRH
jgi:hypothetical protein